MIEPFDAAAPKLWNALPAPLRSADSVVSFKMKLKTVSCLSNPLYNRSVFYVFNVYFIFSSYIVFVTFVARVVT